MNDGNTLVIEELRKINRALKMLSECNQAVVRATEETSLLIKRITNYELRVTNCKLEGEGIDD